MNKSIAMAAALAAMLSTQAQASCDDWAPIIGTWKVTYNLAHGQDPIWDWTDIILIKAIDGDTITATDQFGNDFAAFCTHDGIVLVDPKSDYVTDTYIVGRGKRVISTYWDEESPRLHVEVYDAETTQLSTETPQLQQNVEDPVAAKNARDYQRVDLMLSR